MIILMHAWNRSIEVGSNHYYNVAGDTWRCYQNFFRWAWEEGFGTPQMFQGGWAIKIGGYVK